MQIDHLGVSPNDVEDTEKLWRGLLAKIRRSLTACTSCVSEIGPGLPESTQIYLVDSVVLVGKPRP